MGGKPADTVVGSRTVEAILSDHGVLPRPASVAIGFLSAPPAEPAAESVAGVADGGAVQNETADSGGDPPDTVPRPLTLTRTLTAGALLSPVALGPDVVPAQTGPMEAVPELPAPDLPAPQRAGSWDASDVVTELYAQHYGQLVRLALLLVHDLHTAEEVVQDAFEAMHHAWKRLRDSDKALSYLRQTVVNRSRSVLRHRKVVDLHAPKPAPDEPSAEHAALALIERSAVIAALRHLPVRQREAVVLRYYADLSEASIAEAMGISRGAVKSHTARAMVSLKSILDRETP